MIGLDAARGLPVWDLVERRADESPDRAMLADEDGRRLTFGEYREVALRCSTELAARGVGAGSVVAWQLPTSIDAFVLMGALARLGATQCPLIPILREREVGFIAEQTGASLLVVRESFRGFGHGEMARQLGARLGFQTWSLAGSETLGGVESGSRDVSAAIGAAPAGTPDDDAADPVRWLYYTSGTTADPKGVRHTDRSIISTSTHLVGGIRLQADDSLLTVAPIAHIGGAMTLVAQLLVGFRLALVAAFDPERTPEYAAEHDISILRAPEPVVMACVRAQRAHGATPLYPRLRMVACGGASRSQNLNVLVQEVFGLEGALSSYGMTECPGVATTNLDDSVDRIAASSGRATPGTDIVVVGPDGEPCPVGVEGEIHVSGPQLFSGYVDESLDEGAFDRRGYFRSGDLGVLDADGYLRITGRIKDIIIRNGENISAQEIEDVLGLHPAIDDVAVIAVPDERTGERACAVMQMAPGATPLGLEEIAEICLQGGLSKRKIPERLELVDALPRNAMGKIEKAKLRARYR